MSYLLSAALAASVLAAQPAEPVEDKAGIRWVAIPGGSFLPGSDVKMKPFELSQTEVTNARYRACEAAGACTPAHYMDATCVVRGGKGIRVPGVVPPSYQADDHPVVGDRVGFRLAR